MISVTSTPRALAIFFPTSSEQLLPDLMPLTVTLEIPAFSASCFWVIS
nr:MAG TPA: hypothetical protein [Caudoviricetes sp.]